LLKWLLVAAITALAQPGTASAAPVLQHQNHAHAWRAWCKHNSVCAKNHPWVWRNNPQKRYRAWAGWCIERQKCLNKHPGLAKPSQPSGGSWSTQYITGYCYGQYTANGDYVHVGSAAAGPDVPFGTRYWIPEVGWTVTIDDRGGAVGDGHIDVWLPDCSRADAITGYYQVEQLN
jgi:3D (Asp-Asp-Asp) domain-containing protein